MPVSAFAIDARTVPINIKRTILTTAVVADDLAMILIRNFVLFALLIVMDVSVLVEIMNCCNWMESPLQLQPVNKA